MTGGCQCGNIRYAISTAAQVLYICHCRECQKQSASAFGMSLEIPRESLSLLAGSPKFWSRTADSGNAVECAFCGNCGSRIWHQGSPHSARITVKAGSLDLPIDARDAIHIWTDSMLEGIIIPEGARRFAGEPT